MANPQKEDGYTEIANEIMDALARIRISGEARQVLDTILRKTYGWHKKEDVISLSQFVSMTGLKKPTVCKAINKLLSINIITKKDNARGVSYQFQKNYDKWKPLPKKIIVTQKDNKSLPKKIHTKETSTKERKEKKEKKKPIISDEQFYKKLKETYPDYDIDEEFTKMDGWLLNNPKRVKSRRFIINWFNNIGKFEEKPFKSRKDIEDDKEIDRIQELVKKSINPDFKKNT